MGWSMGHETVVDGGWGGGGWGMGHGAWGGGAGPHPIRVAVIHHQELGGVGALVGHDEPCDLGGLQPECGHNTAVGRTDGPRQDKYDADMSMR